MSPRIEDSSWRGTPCACGAIQNLEVWRRSVGKLMLGASRAVLAEVLDHHTPKRCVPWRKVGS